MLRVKRIEVHVFVYGKLEIVDAQQSMMFKD